MAWTSTTPAVITALVALWQSTDGLSGTSVDDGPKVTNSSATERLTVGYTGDMTPSAVEGTLTREGLATAPDREQYTIQCALTVTRMNTDIVSARARAYELLGYAGQAIATNHTLGVPGVLNVRLAAVTLTQSQGTSGAAARIMFGVEVDAYSGR